MVFDCVLLISGIVLLINLNNPSTHARMAILLTCCVTAIIFWILAIIMIIAFGIIVGMQSSKWTLAYITQVLLLNMKDDR